MYRPFLTHLEQELNRRFTLEPLPIPEGLAYNHTARAGKEATIQSWAYSSPDFRKIRYTYIDAGDQAQVFNGVLYPHYHYDLPVLGLDLLAFGNKKFLTVIDIQPLYQDVDYQARYVAPMQPIYERYGDLAQKFEMRFYDANIYFSKYLLFARTEPELIQTRVFAAYQDYLALYLEMLETARATGRRADPAQIQQAHRDYDQYSAERDPAIGLFTTYWGKEWAERFVYDFLFDLAVVPAPI
ncbi:15,16-dihydrobiliverdin:ferredoxin oxidoreductase [Candidatus Cyanaurora vandensis]|uniref:15,16-dihydrobiliverdin:ferredoxin oxidoreductase n=1 Tax=Candidatus Cyanaurora vandensis TaxID=2714958 RepID=UPI00257CE163|nr:15,16-dihydrobiliverdin:ferredoxin oxidoreductase [Candidatus Cyanaurora vandensis]